MRYGGSANSWGFAIHLASRERYEDAALPSGYPVGAPKKHSTAPAASTSTTHRLDQIPDELTGEATREVLRQRLERSPSFGHTELRQETQHGAYLLLAGAAL